MKWNIYWTADVKSNEAMILVVINAITKFVTWFHVRGSKYDSFHTWHLRWFIHHWNISTHKWPVSNFCGFIAQSVEESHPSSRGHGFKPRWSPEFFRLLYAIAKNAFIKARIIASIENLQIRVSFTHYVRFCCVLLFPVPRKFALPLVSVGIFCIGVPSALNINILINQVRDQFVILVGTFQFFEKGA